MALRILHMSDLHFGPTCRYLDPVNRDLSDTGRKLAGLLLNDLRGHNLLAGIAVVIVSGDLTWKKMPAEFDAALAFLQQLAARLELPLDNFVVVPGNHDITWSEADPARTKQYRYLMQARAEAEYRRFYMALRGGQANLYLLDVAVFKEERVVLVGFNSCRLHEKRNAGLGYVGRDQIEAALRMLRDDPHYSVAPEESFKIGILHHHVLPMQDLDLAELGKPPADRKFSMTVDAKAVLDLLLADNFALVLHGHQHVPLWAVERRLECTEMEPKLAQDVQIAVLGAGSLSVGAPHAKRNHFQVIDLDENTVKICGVELLWDDPAGVRRQTYTAELQRTELTRPPTSLPLREPKMLLEDLHRQAEAESDLLAEEVSEQDPFAVSFLFDLVLPVCRRWRELGLAFAKLTDAGLRELFDQALAVWWQDPAALTQYQQAKAQDGVTFPDYVQGLMLVLHAA